MKQEDIKNNIGSKVYITGDRDLAMQRNLRQLILNKTELTIARLTQSGEAYLMDSDGRYYSAPTRNVKLI